MSKARLSKRPISTRLTAGMLLAGFLLLTMAPVCGSASDVDPEACCQRHGCQQSALGSNFAGGGSLHGHETCASHDRSSCSSRDSAEDCCRLGALAYPTARAQSAEQPVAPVLTLYRAILSGLGLPNAGTFLTQSRSASPPLKTGCVALYTLHSAFRI